MFVSKHFEIFLMKLQITNNQNGKISVGIFILLVELCVIDTRYLKYLSITIEANFQV
jgi:hypothetical protein